MSLKKNVATRSYDKYNITRMHKQLLVLTIAELQDISHESLITRRDRVTRAFKEYGSYNKEIFFLDPADAEKENVSEVEKKYFQIIETLCQQLKRHF